MLKPFRFHIILFIALVLGAIVLQFLLNSHYKSIETQNKDRLLKVHSDAMLRAKAGIDVYAALVSSIRSYIKNSPELPSEIQLQNFLKDLIIDLEFNDSIVVNYLNTDHEFEYVFSPNQIDVAKLKGKSAVVLRPKEEIDKLNELMQSDEILLFDPINLREGWAGFPFNFSVKNFNGEAIGYLAPIINVKYLLNYFYTKEDIEFIHHFNINNKFDISREVIYDGTPIFNRYRDDQYFKNFSIDPDKFISSNLNLFGLDLKVGSAFKKEPEIQSNLAVVSYIWYAALLLFSIITLGQYVRNTNLNKKLKIANTDIEEKNVQLEKSISHVQTLIKEIHHRIKNNMMMITGLLEMQSDEYEDPNIKKALEQSMNRIQSMSLIHEKLYGSDTLTDIKAIDYIKQLINFIEQTVKKSDLKIEKDLKIAETLTFDGETMVPLGLILNELITNSYKYAFRPGKKNILRIEVSTIDSGYILNYSDNGPGIPDNIDITDTTSLGMQLITVLSEELHGSVSYSKNDFSTFKIPFKLKY